jgi:hypothetical protein
MLQCLPCWLAAGIVAGVLALVACSGEGAPGTPQPEGLSAAPSPSATATPPPSARAEAQALARLGMRSPLDVTYRIRRPSPQLPHGQVRVRMSGDRYRVDVVRGPTTSTLLTTRRGLVSCRTSPGNRSCYLVSTAAGKPPPLFDPGVQRIFRHSLRRLARSGNGLTVTRSGPVAETRYGPARCFAVRGDLVDRGRYCLLVQGQFQGVPVRVEYRSGTLLAVAIDRSLSKDAFQPMVRPTPLPS